MTHHMSDASLVSFPFIILFLVVTNQTHPKSSRGASRVLNRVGTGGSKGNGEDWAVQTAPTKWANGYLRGIWASRGNSAETPSNTRETNEA